MKEQFDKELRNHIKDTFGAFDDHLADDGWLKLTNRKKKKRRAFFIWYILPSGIAASIAYILFFNFGNDVLIEKNKNIIQDEVAAIDLPNHKSENKKIEIKNTKSKDINLSKQTTNKDVREFVKTKATEKLEDVEIEESIKASNKIVQSKNTIQETAKIENLSSILKEVVTNKRTNTNISEESFGLKASNANSNQEVAQKKELVTIINSENIVGEQKIYADNSSNYTRENVEEIYTQEKRFISPKSQNNEKLTAKTITNKLNTSIDRLVALNQTKTDTKNEKPKQLGKKFKIGVDANTYLNFNENGLQDKLNIGLGLISEYRLTNKLSINTGIALNSQNSVFNGSQKSNQDFLSFRSVSASFAAVPSAQVTSAKLVGLDIPLSLKYQLQFGKTKSFFSTGFSSYSVINERYNNEFSVINYSFTGVNTSNVSNIVDNPEGQFSYFKFARTIDVSFGILYPISKKNTLSIEPFMKYPLSGLGYQDLKIGASGLSFKMNFGK